MAGSLTEDQIAFFRDKGYLYPLRALSEDDAKAYRARLEAYEAESGEEMNQRLKIKGHLAFPWMCDLARHPAIVGAVESLIGPDILLFGTTVFAKNAHDPRFVSFHQDSAYYGLDPHEEVTVWLALSPADKTSGCMSVLPESHVGPDLQHEETYDPQNMLVRGQTLRGIDESTAVAMPLETGEFSMHHERTVHGSPANNSDDRRIGIAFFYMPAHVRSTLGRRSAMPVKGVDRHGHWDHEPEPRFDLDPVSLGHLDSMLARYTDKAVKQAAAGD